jgi:hypothetical protein
MYTLSHLYPTQFDLNLSLFYTIVSGTDFTYIIDVVDDARAVADNFAKGYEDVDYSTGYTYGPFQSGGVKGQQYDICAGKTTPPSNNFTFPI